MTDTPAPEEREDMDRLREATDHGELLREAAQSIRSDGTPAQVGLTANECDRIADEIDRLRSKATHVPEGWKLVPTYLTEAMISAAVDLGSPGSFDPDVTWDDIYTAMLSASPLPPVTEDGSEWRCPVCNGRTYARLDKREPDGSFKPSSDVRCVECKSAFYNAAPLPPAATYDVVAASRREAELIAAYKRGAEWVKERCVEYGIDAKTLCLDYIGKAACDYADKITHEAQLPPGTEDGWRDISTAPKDRLIDIWIKTSDGGVRWIECYYDHICDEWRTSRPSGRLVSVKARSVTHWMLPLQGPGASPLPTVVEAGTLTADFTNVLPGNVLDDTSYEQIELALDSIGAPCQAEDGRWLKLHERITARQSALSAAVEAETERCAKIAETFEGYTSSVPGQYVDGNENAKRCIAAAIRSGQGGQDV